MRLSVRRPKLVVPVVIALLLLVTGGFVHRAALADLRQIERDYLAAREPTACATQGLLPFAFGEIDLEELDRALEELVVEAGRESAEVRRRVEGRRVAPFPPVRSARDALEDALRAQTSLYEAMIERPDESEEELRALGRRNADVERKLARARNTLIVGRPTGWDRRFVCDEPPPATPADPGAGS